LAYGEINKNKFYIYKRNVAGEVHCLCVPLAVSCYMNTLSSAFPNAMAQNRNARARTAFF